MHLSKFIFNPFSVLYRTMWSHASPSLRSTVLHSAYPSLRRTRPRRAIAKLCYALPLLCLCFAAPNTAVRSPGFSSLYASLLRFAFASQCFTQPRRAITVPHLAFAMQCDALPSPRRVSPCLRSALISHAVTPQCHTSPNFALTLPCTTQLCCAHASRSVALPSPRQT